MDDRIKKRFEEIDKTAKKGGYLLNTDSKMTMALIDGLVKNNDRYGEEICPCRLFKGTMDNNQDIICPCYYRDDDIAEYGSCFCGLYVSPEVAMQGSVPMQTPERRLPIKDRQKQIEEIEMKPQSLSYPVWRCRVCGYLCANTDAPKLCPVCKAKKERFERFI